MHLKNTIRLTLAVLLTVALGFSAGCATGGGSGGTSMKAERNPATVRPAELPDWWFHDEVDAEFVKKHMVIPRDKEEVMIIDARPYMAKYVKGYIPTAFSVSQTQIKEKLPEVLPKNKGSLVIFYCGGYT
jgi:hypothetical protein